MQAQRNRVLDALERCIYRNGVADTSMGDIVKESGMSIGAIYRYFAGKEKILLAAVERGNLRINDGTVFKLYKDAVSFWDIVDTSLAYFKNLKNSKSGLVTLELITLARIDPNVRAAFAANRQAWHAFLKHRISMLPGEERFKDPAVLDILVGGLYAIGSDLSRQSMLGLDVDTVAARAQVELLVEGAVAKSASKAARANQPLTAKKPTSRTRAAA